MAKLIGPGYLFLLLILLFGFLYGFRRWKSLGPAYKLVSYLLFVVFLAQFSAKLIVVLFQHSNHGVFHILIPLQGLLYGLIFSKLITRKSKPSRYPFYLGLSFSLISIGLSIYHSMDGFAFPSANISLLSVFMLSGSFLLYYQLIQKPSEQSLFRQSTFWFATANLVFYAGSFLIFGLYDWMLVQDGQLPTWARKVIYFLNYFLYGSYIISIYLDATNQRQAKWPLTTMSFLFF